VGRGGRRGVAGGGGGSFTLPLEWKLYHLGGRSVVFVEGGWGGGWGISVGVTAARGGGNIYSTYSHSICTVMY
jgi:hypothetical protein